MLKNVDVNTSQSSLFTHNAIAIMPTIAALQFCYNLSQSPLTSPKAPSNIQPSSETPYQQSESFSIPSPERMSQHLDVLASDLFHPRYRRRQQRWEGGV